MGSKQGKKRDAEDIYAEGEEGEEREEGAAGAAEPPEAASAAPSPKRTPRDASLEYTHCDYFVKFLAPKDDDEEEELKKMRLHTVRADVRKKLQRSTEAIAEMRESVKIAASYGDAPKGLVNFELGKLLLWADCQLQERDQGALTREALTNFEDSKFMLLLEIPDDAQNVQRVGEASHALQGVGKSRILKGAGRSPRMPPLGSKTTPETGPHGPPDDPDLDQREGTNASHPSRSTPISTPAHDPIPVLRKKQSSFFGTNRRKSVKIEHDDGDEAKPKGWFNKAPDGQKAPASPLGPQGVKGRANRRASLAKMLQANNPDVMDRRNPHAANAMPTFTPKELQDDDAQPKPQGLRPPNLLKPLSSDALGESQRSVTTPHLGPSGGASGGKGKLVEGITEKERFDYLHLKLCNVLELLADTYWSEMRKLELGSSLRKHYQMQAENSRKALIDELAQIHGPLAKLLAPQYKCLADFYTEVFNFTDADTAFRKAALIEQGGIVRGLSILWKDRLDKAKMQDKEERAAIRVQAVFRAWLDRRLVKEMKRDAQNTRSDPLAQRRVLPFCRTCGEKQGGRYCAGCGDRLVMR